jgi:hypothetical protein
MKLDRTAFKMGTHQESGHNYDYWQKKSAVERLQAAFYLNSVAYNFDYNKAPRLDRKAFSMRKNE